MDDEVWGKVEQLLQEMVSGQQVKLLHCGRRIVPTLTPEDVLQPNDYLELENHPYFRYEEGMLAGIQSVQMALWAWRKAHEETKET